MGLGICADDFEESFIQRKPSPGMKFSLKRIRVESNLAVANDPQRKVGKRRLVRKHLDFGSDDEKNLFRAIRNKAWLSYPVESSSEDDSDMEKMSSTRKPSSLPVGVVRGCSSCDSCQKVLTRWRPEAGCRPELEDAPVFFPLEEEFQDVIKYIASITAEAEPYGICRIVPPHSWRPPCPLKDNEKRKTTKFPTRVQRLDKLQVREAKVKKEQRKRKRGRPPRNVDDVCNDSSDEDGKFGFEPGPPFTLETFEQYAKQFKDDYFGLNNGNQSSDNPSKDEPSVECIEGEYWRIVEHATEQLEVLYGADIETGKFGSGFPKAIPGGTSKLYENCGWNLNNIARLVGSVLSFEEEEISGVLVPWLYVGMCLSSFCWHVEDHHFYSLNYMHFGSPKVWYGVPGSAAEKMEDAMKKHLPALFEEQPDLLHKLVTQLSPSVLKADGVPVYRAVQKPGEFVVTFPRAYHAGFNCGFNCAEAVNVAPVDWLPAGQIAVELYKQQKRKSTVSHDKLLLGAAKKYVSILCHQVSKLPSNADSTAWHDSFVQHDCLATVFKERVYLERSRRCKIEGLVHIMRMDKSFDLTDAKECTICNYDLHLSAIGCECSLGRFVCLDHVHELCSCEKSKKHALYRYELSELDEIVAALEQKCEYKSNVQKLLELLTGSEISRIDCNEPEKQGEIKLTSEIPKVDCNDVEKPEGASIEYSGSNSAAADLTSALFSHNIGPADNSGTCVQTMKPCTPTESASNGVISAMSAFLLKDFENFALPKSEELPNPAGCIHSNSKQLTCHSLPCEKVTMQRTEDVEVIVLSDDDECPGRRSMPNISLTINAPLAATNQTDETLKAAHIVTNKTINIAHAGTDGSTATKGIDLSCLPTSSTGSQCISNFFCTVSTAHAKTKVIDVPEEVSLFKELPPVLHKPISQALGTSGFLQVRSDKSPLISTHERKSLPALTLQQTRPIPVFPSFYSCFRDSTMDSAIDIASAKDWLCLGHAQTPSVDCNISVPEPTIRHCLFEDLSTTKHMQSTSAVECSLGGDLHDGFAFSQQREGRVDLLNIGRLVLGIAWYNKDAIFPAGFRSRVLFTSFLDPCKMCFYTSEILDYGRLEPIFKVTMEDHPDEVFVHGSIDKCWQMVQERVNIVIQLHHSFGKVGLPPLRSPKDIRGLDLFGFSSPHIIQAVESLDWQHQCVEYWRGKVTAVGLLQTQHQMPLENAIGLEYVITGQHSRTMIERPPQLELNTLPLHNLWH